MQSNTAAQISTIAAKPILKWAGGKTQMLGELLPKVPSSYGRYIEPFFGGGALFFALQPENAVIADSNPELINMYRQVADHVDDVISYLEKYQNTSEMFYSVRSLDWETLPKAEAAARTIYLNRTCYNGLYRVNKKGQFICLCRQLLQKQWSRTIMLPCRSMRQRVCWLRTRNPIILLQAHLSTAAEINIARQRLENILAQTDEIQYANDQCNQWQEIRDYMTLLIRGGGKLVYDEDNAIEVPKDETPAYLEWTLWRAALAIDHMVNKPYEVRGFKLDSDFMPVSAAGGGKGDLYCEFNDFTILTEVTMSTSSRQEAMEGEPVRRHVSDAVLKYDKPVYGMFIAVRIDTNTAETFRHGMWYAKGDVKQRLDIVPLTLAQFQKYFVAMFEADKANPEQLRELILKCESRRDILEAPAWKQYIDATVSDKATKIISKMKRQYVTF